MMTAKLLLSYLLQTVDPTGLNIDASKIDVEQAYCLAKNVYYESKGEDIKGQFAVATVTLNRVKDSRYPTTICEVVKQRTVHRVTKRLVCQFSWYCEKGKGDRDISFRNKDGTINQVLVDKFQIASIVAITSMVGEVPDVTRGATHFHNPDIVVPAWARTLRKTGSIGNHDFYALPPVKD